MDIYIGMIVQTGFSFSIYNFTYCMGQLLPISENQALFSLLGTTYGGDGRVTYGIPDLRGRTAVGFGQGHGSSYWNLGQWYGNETHTMTTSEMPMHTHFATFTPTGGGASDPITATATVRAHEGLGNQNNATGNYWATGTYASGPSQVSVLNGYSNSANKVMAPDAVEIFVSGGGGGITGGIVTNADSGGSQQFSIIQPTLAINYQIAIVGNYPARN